jgi:hypothetical protein
LGPEASSATSCSDRAAGDLHILSEEAFAPEADRWEMLCGVSCHAADDGTLTPRLEFHRYVRADLATCEGCLAAFAVHAPPRH